MVDGCMGGWWMGGWVGELDGWMVDGWIGGWWMGGW